MATPERYCQSCGARLASDHAGDGWCSPCLSRNRAYDPRADPDFLIKLVDVLVAHRGCPVEPLKALGIGPEHRGYVKQTIRFLRRNGYDIRAQARVSGYVYVCETGEYGEFEVSAVAL